MRTATLVDPREVLEGAQVVLGGYAGPVGGVKNLLNAFGYWENQAYGGSFATEAGIVHVVAGPLVRSSYHADGQAALVRSLRRP